MKTLLLLGSTGSIGTQTLALVRADPTRLGVAGLSAFRSWRELCDQALEFQPRVVALEDSTRAEELRAALPPSIALLHGPGASEELARTLSYDIAVNGIVGAAGLRPSVAVLDRGSVLALANKESLVVAGELLMEHARARGGTIVPVDSEHAAIFQCLSGADLATVRRVWLTASGGSLRDLRLDQLSDVTPAQALAHPTWDMGPRITLGSATLMNKALEVIEAHHLYGLEPERIGVVLHRQSVVHSLVEFHDGSVLAQMGPPDMRGPIHHALHYPERVPADLSGFDFATFRSLTFEEVDRERFPALELGFDCVRAGGDAGCVLNAADEVACAAFLEGKISFQDIVPIGRSVLEHRTGAADSIDALLRSDQRARELAAAEVARRANSTSPNPSLSS